LTGFTCVKASIFLHHIYRRSHTVFMDRKIGWYRYCWFNWLCACSF